jgi:hypothetical protein
MHFYICLCVTLHDGVDSTKVSLVVPALVACRRPAAANGICAEAGALERIPDIC